MCLCQWEHFANYDSSLCCHFGVVTVKSAFALLLTKVTKLSMRNHSLRAVTGTYYK
ncbi:MAG: hypothetical protein ACERKN_13695 [Velocimicrobium sp.]